MVVLSAEIVIRQQILGELIYINNMAFGVDLTTPTSYSYGTDYSGYFDSPLYEIGVEENQWKPKSIEFHLGRPLRTGEGIRFAYRTDLAASFTTIKTLAFADNGVGAITSKTFTTEKPKRLLELLAYLAFPLVQE